MNKKIIIKHILEVKAEDLKNNLVNNFLEVLSDYKEETVEEFTIQAGYFHEALKDVRDGNWRKLFNEGTTMMMLKPDDFEYVDQFFTKKNATPYNLHELEIHVLPSEDFLFEGEVVIKERDIQY